MTKEELIRDRTSFGLSIEEAKEIIRVCGEEIDWFDIPAYIRERWKNKALRKYKKDEKRN